MKTAMQELKESLQSINERYHLKNDSDWLMNEVLDLVENFLEKEKEQIENAYWDGGQDVPTNGDRCQEYYNQTYNQNK